MEAWQIEPCLLGYESVGYLRTFLVVPSLMRMMFKRPAWCQNRIIPFASCLFLLASEQGAKEMARE